MECGSIVRVESGISIGITKVEGGGGVWGWGVGGEWKAWTKRGRGEKRGERGRKGEGEYGEKGEKKGRERKGDKW